MKLEILKDSENYTCQVIKLPVKIAVPGLDNLVQVTYQGNQCLVGKDSNPDELYLFFPAECCLSDIYCNANNLYRDCLLNQDGLQKGFFENTGRVKAIKFKGVISTGFIIPIKSLNGIIINWEDLKVGDEFNSINNQEVCKKYKKIFQKSSGPKESKHNKKLKRFDKLIHNQFRFHQNTSHLAKNLHQFTPDDIIVITDKWHGTSAIFANVLVKTKPTWKDKIIQWFNLVNKWQPRTYDVVYASRKVVKNQYINTEVQLGYYNEDIWKVVLNEIKEKIEQGITLYGEIVGYLPGGKHIQRGYDYGCDSNNGEHKFVVYRITYTKIDGSVIEFSWQQIKEYCKKYELETVKELYFGRLIQTDWVETNIIDELLINKLSEEYLEKDCTYCKNKVPAEGICVRIDGKENYHTYKLKAKRFLEYETKELDKQTEINIEDITDENMVS